MDIGAEVDKLKIQGIGTLVEPRRKYPQQWLASQVIGSVGTDNYGLSGLEARFEKGLHGTDGSEKMVKDALGRPVSIEVTKQPQQGSDLHLTLDANIQERVEAVLSDVGQHYTPKGATALVMDPRNGSILALANWPRVNANDPGGAPAYARQDRAVASSYEPGSTFKAFTVSGALQDGLITPNTPFYLPPTIEVADRKISDAHPRGAETLTVTGILAQSSNVGRREDRPQARTANLRPLGARRSASASRRAWTCPASRPASCCTRTSTRARRWATCRSARARRSRRSRWPPPTRRSRTPA